jgi:PAS domain S-box-containing protein
MSRSVLVVEDDDAIRDSLIDVLRAEGWTVDHVPDGRQALERLRRGAALPDVILLDLMLPVMNGWEFRIAQRADPTIAAVPVVAMSADHSAKASAIDAHAYLRKPLDIDVLHSTLLDTVHRRAARELDDARRRMASIIENTDDAMIWVDADGVIGMWNPAAERLLGYTAAEAHGQPVAMLVPESHEDVFVAVASLLRDGTAMKGLHTRHRRKDGSTVDVSVSAAPIRDADGTITGGALTYRDVSEHPRVEEQVLLADVLASMASLSGGIAHELNNPLAAVVVNLDVIAADIDSLELPPEKRFEFEDMLADARHAAERVRLVVQDLRALSRTDESARDAVDVRQVLEASLRVAWNVIRHRARVVRDYQDVPPIDGNTGRLGQIFLNLILGATYAFPVGAVEKHELRLRTWRDGDRVVVELSDTGEGVRKADLALSRTLVVRMGGRVTAASEHGRGTTVRVELPIGAPQKGAAPRPRPRTSPLSERRGRVLVVERDPMVARAVDRILSREHEVVVERSARSAAERIESGERFDVILCDLMMPEVTGAELHAELTKIDPDQANRMIFLTGGAFSPASQTFLERVTNLCFEKPCDIEELRAAVRRGVNNGRP